MITKICRKRNGDFKKKSDLLNCHKNVHGKLKKHFTVIKNYVNRLFTGTINLKVSN